MFLIGIIIHITFLFSIFDIYFKSPIIKDVISHVPEHDALADRLVLFVVDGLRAESFVNYSTLSYLRTIANVKGRWGISHTRVPTESRPGHVAVLAGFYEDPSAVAKGWKENPTDFDSVLNRTKYSFCWGAYDIIGIFTKQNTNHIFAETFDIYDGTFNTNQSAMLSDKWVFDNVEKFFANAKQDKTLMNKLKQKKIMFFLHLLGTDTSGHTHKPKTEKFLATIEHVDKGIKRIENIVREFYDDDQRTTFLMTSDHGMTDWGSHGAGDEHETQTPYVIWGAGVKSINSNKETMGLSTKNRLDLEQADMTPLMSTILSIPVPVNSIGRINTELLNMTLENKAKAVYSNCRQLANQYNKKRSDIEDYALKALYKPFVDLNKDKLKEIIQITEELLEKGDYKQAIEFSNHIIELSLSGLIYYHNYYQITLLVLVTCSFLGWIFYLLSKLLVQTMNTQTEHNFKTKKLRLWTLVLDAVLLTIAFISFILVFVQNLPYQYNIYILLPLILWRQVFLYLDAWIKMVSWIKTRRRVLLTLTEIICYVIGSFAMGLSFTHRWMLSIPLLGMGLWPFFSSIRKYLSYSLLFSWAAGCILLSIFSFMPVVGKDVSIELVLFGGFLWLMILCVFAFYVLIPKDDNQYIDHERNKSDFLMIVLQMFLLLVSLQNVNAQSIRYETGAPVVNFYQVMSWIVAVLTPIIPLGHSKKILNRLVGINTAIINFYLLLSVAHECLFIVALIVNISCWVFIEYKLLNKKEKITECCFESTSELLLHERSINSEDFRRAFFFTLYIILAFFGTGNIASLNSFEVRWVTCFITSFSPFIITGLILLKTLSPFLCVGCSFRAVQYLTKAPTGYLNVMVLIYSNLMGIQLLFQVRNIGSWLEIGTSISQFVIVQVITLFIVIIHQISKFLTDFSWNNLKLFNKKKIV